APRPGPAFPRTAAPPLSPVEAPTQVIMLDEAGGAARAPATPSLARASGSMVIANAVSRLTGFLRQIMLVSVVGIGAVNDSYNVANTLPNILYELLLGGVLASVVIPTLVRAQHEDADGGEAFTQRLLTLSFTVLAAGTVLAVALAPLLTKLYFSSGGQDVPALTTAFSRLLLPEILFYGLFGLWSGVLNSRHVFKPGAWAPVLNNVVMFATFAVYLVLPGEISLNPVRMGEPKLLVLGVGTTLGIVLQALVLVPPLLRVGVRFRWRWGWDRRLGTFGRLSGWLVLYTLVSQVAYVELTRVATGAAPGSYTIYSTSWLLLQVPYGVLGVSLLTAIMPRMSKAAAEGDLGGVVENLSTGNRMSSVLLIPLCAMMTVLGPQIGVALFALRHTETGHAAVIGLTLTTSAFGLVFYAITMMQLRAFYALNDARTPTVLNGVMVVVRLALFYLTAHVLDPHHVVYGLTFVNAISYVIGAIGGDLWLRRKIGPLDTGRTVRTMVKVGVASAWGAGAALLLAKGIEAVIPVSALLVRAWVVMVFGALFGLAVTFGLMTLLGVAEIRPVVRRLSGLLSRG
ncbi:MAG TPA: murein biosynthesis integral membrane protein MurJ, partial [Pseudonocardiaceae bacterium]|nr:murein biosynthesis integral membrane protein MurJ [Pseudonocardiaceae bacterium]